LIKYNTAKYNIIRFNALVKIPYFPEYAKIIADFSGGVTKVVISQPRAQSLQPAYWLSGFTRLYDRAKILPVSDSLYRE